ncbi:hypothetical protein NSK_001711 [Nannochloropsis salina CCMP1776]|jgi:2-polyprenyl-6-methoxyphenol hydroxylase-like FAD-dependent oxidoreductase|uniref:FAD-binding domain-containing protein n=1 Tax=Nannochloropsis salina CCMP1776 TaxID=1027361 RepID=A0A4D9DFC5_9STRA|nr:hypothetical protein NSK_001711 [Nannochloropsis salina CCMP1776]|eukprot:TFJ87379.1 hypothetical protein NSK_001711 [Nannochloropsis salina CCMP1776]
MPDSRRFIVPWAQHVVCFLVILTFVSPLLFVEAYRHPRSLLHMAVSSTSPNPIHSSSTSIKELHCNVLIAGGGPAGLAAALSLARRGYQDIHVLERNPSAEYFEVDKSYLYRIDGRGQRLTGLLGITDAMQEVSITTEEFLNITIVQADGSVKVVKAPADPSQQTAYWLPRRALLSFLYDRIQKEDCGKAISFHWGVTIQRFVMPPPEKTAQITAQAKIVAALGDGTSTEFVSQKVIGCDGMNSRIRKGLEAWAASDPKKTEEIPSKSKERSTAKRVGRRWGWGWGKRDGPRFGLQYVDAPSAGLRYKILAIQDGFPLTHAEPDTPTRRETCYSYVGLPKGYFSPPLRLGLLPFKMQGIPRTANIIASPSADIFGLEKGQDVIAFLKRELPQCDVDQMVSPEEAERFARSSGGFFPRPQYCLDAQQVLGGRDGRQGAGGVVLMGDAIHAFPPDLGAGVNIALLDVLDFIFSLDKTEGDWAAALPLYETLRGPQSRAVCELIPIGFPQQYNHMLPVQKSLKLMGVGLRAALHKVFPRILAPPVFFMCQDVRWDYSQVLARATRTTRVLRTVGVLLLGAVLWRWDGGRGVREFVRKMRLGCVMG